MFDEDAIHVGAWATSVVASVRSCIVETLAVYWRRQRASWIGRRFRLQ